MSDLRQIIDATIINLEEMKRTGITHVEVSRETLAELKKPRVAAAAPAALVRKQPPGTAAATPDLEQLKAATMVCVKCSELARCRNKVVFGTGNIHAELMFVGEAPGADEDEQGLPFVGRAGQLLTKIIEAMGFQREEVYIANVLKCRPPENRPPLPDEVTNCMPYLLAQIDIIKPKVMVALGATAVRSLLNEQLGITKMRGNWYTFHNIPIMPTFHPAYLLRNPPAKKEVWDDMKTVLAKLGREVPRR
ncbi:MAG: uracil-DNA glycosylase [Verrucomicrobiota bacterium]